MIFDATQRVGPPMIFTIGHSTRSVTESSDCFSRLRSTCSPMCARYRAHTPTCNSTPNCLPALFISGSPCSPPDATPSPNTLWRNDAFRNYADYATTGTFRAGLDELKALASDHCCPIMCAEAIWWRCHRRIIAAYLLAEGLAVAHIMGPGKIHLATSTPGARPLPDGTILYPGG